MCLGVVQPIVILCLIFYVFRRPNVGPITFRFSDIFQTVVVVETSYMWITQSLCQRCYKQHECYHACNALSGYSFVFT